jgi:hypothetical protein
MKTVQHNNKTYYVNGVSGELKDLLDRTMSKERKAHLLFEQPEAVFFYNHKNFQGNPDYLGDAVGILENIKQPTADRVRHAMIWGLGYAGESFDYMIKAGGESGSDNMFSSSLSVMIAHPKTGLDTDVVILKKYSTKIEDVYITEAEVRALYKLCQTPDETKKVNQTKVKGGVGMLWRSFQGFKVNIGKTSKIATKKQVEMMTQFLFEVGTPEAIEAQIDKMISNRSRNLETTLNEEVSSSTTKEFHAETRAALKLMQEFKLSLLNRQAA